MINSELAQKIKEEIGYCGESSRCGLCMYRRTKEDSFLDRSWNEVCTVAGELGDFIVETNGCCKKFKRTGSPVVVNNTPSIVYRGAGNTSKRLVNTSD